MDEGTAPCRLFLVGGYLGAGKTTTLLAAAERLQAAGHRVALVTNDQGRGLVDTWTAEAAGWPVTEVAGGCFCCRFDDLLQGTVRLRAAAPDVILAEPVGSCTDLQATVVNPLRRLAPAGLHVGPLTVVVDPAVARTLSATATAADAGPALAPDAAPDPSDYLRERQVAEADVILLNKTDLLAPAEVAPAVAELSRLYPRATVLPLSATTGAGIDAWVREIWDGAAGGRALDLDYDRYAAAEAALAWLNATGLAAAPVPLSAEALAVTLLQRLQEELRTAGGRIAHIKCTFHPDAAGAHGVRAHLTTAGGVAVAPGPGDGHARHLRWRLNARVETAPATLRAAAMRAMDHLAQTYGAAVVWERTEALRPARPNPTHRMEA